MRQRKYGRVVLKVVALGLVIPVIVYFSNDAIEMVTREFGLMPSDHVRALIVILFAAVAVSVSLGALISEIKVLGASGVAKPSAKPEETDTQRNIVRSIGRWWIWGCSIALPCALVIAQIYDAPNLLRSALLALAGLWLVVGIAPILFVMATPMIRVSDLIRGIERSSGMSFPDIAMVWTLAVTLAGIVGLGD